MEGFTYLRITFSFNELTHEQVLPLLIKLLDFFKRSFQLLFSALLKLGCSILLLSFPEFSHTFYSFLQSFHFIFAALLAFLLQSGLQLFAPLDLLLLHLQISSTSTILFELLLFLLQVLANL
jgi:hypothetical protein